MPATNEALISIRRLQAVMRQWDELRNLLVDVAERARAAGVLAAAQSSTQPFLFVCGVRLEEIAAGAARGAQVLAEASREPAGDAEWQQWIRRAQQEALRVAEAGREIERLASQASLLALDANLRAWHPVGEIAVVAEQLRQAGQKIPGLAAETVWAADDAARPGRLTQGTGPA